MINRILQSTLRAGIPFGVFMGIFFGCFHGLKAGVSGGVTSGVLFGVIMGVFVESQRRKLESKSQIFENESILFQGPANHLLKAEGRGGWLTLTTTRLAFRSHGKNIQNQPLDIPIFNVSRCTSSLTLGFIPNGLKVETKEGDIHHFVVSERSMWAKCINEAMQAQQDAAANP